MFSLIIAVIAIALVVALVAASSYYGGSGVSESTAQAEAARLKNEEQQILGAVEMFNADKGRWPANVQELVNTGYLSSIPRGWVMAQAGSSLQTESFAYIPSAFAADVADGWTTPLEGSPVFETRSGVPELICSKYNLITRGDDGILKHVFTGQVGQCYGAGGDYKVVIYKGAMATSLSTALGSSTVQQGDIPAPSEVFWDKLPNGDVKAATDPEKVPFASLMLTPTSALDLGAVELGRSSLSAARTLVNEGNIPATALSISAGGAFSVTNSSCGTSLDAGSSCSFAVQFTPTQANSYSDNVSISSANGGNLSFSVQGYGNQAQLSVNPSSASFAGTQTGEFRTSGLITARNDGNAPTTGLTIAAPAGFSIVNSNCGTSIPAGSSCDFRVKFEPSQAVGHSGTVDISSSNAGTRQISVSGTGIAPAGHVTGSIFGDVAMGSSLDRTSTLTNTGVGVLSLSTPDASSVSGTGFSFVDTTCGTSLAAGAQCTVTTRFTPATLATETGSLRVSSGAGELTAGLTGRGTGSVAVLVTSGPVTLSDWYQTGTKTANVTYRNNGNTALTLTSPALTSPLTITANSCSNIAPGNNCDVTVALVRDANTGGSGSQAFAPAGASVAPQGVTVNWAIASNIASWAPASLDFSGVQVNKTATQNATLTNNGSVAAAWTSLVGLPTGYTANLSACGNVAPAGGSCSVPVTFAPMAAQPYNQAGIYPAPANINANTLSVSGTGTSNPAIVASPTSISKTTTSPTAGSQVVTFSNNGGTPTTLNLAWASGGSGITITPATLTCPANGSCGSATLTSGTAAATYTGTLRATPAAGGTAADIPTTFTVQSAAAATLSSTSFGTVNTGSSQTNTVTLTNTGGVPLSVTLPATVTGSYFSYQGTTCTASLAVGANCTFSIRFAPGGSSSYSGNLSVVTGAGTKSTSFSGDGYTPPPPPQTYISASPSSYDFGSLAVGGTSSTVYFTFTNTSSVYASLTGSRIATGQFTVWSTSCQGGLAPGESCQLGVQFKPTSKGATSGWVYPQVSNGSGEWVSVSGTGL